MEGVCVLCPRDGSSRSVAIKKGPDFVRFFRWWCFFLWGGNWSLCFVWFLLEKFLDGLCYTIFCVYVVLSVDGCDCVT